VVVVEEVLKFDVVCMPYDDGIKVKARLARKFILSVSWLNGSAYPYGGRETVVNGVKTYLNRKNNQNFLLTFCPPNTFDVRVIVSHQAYSIISR
jgi:hypothetical protein